MSEQERVNEAKRRLEAICAELGVEMMGDVSVKQYGAMLQIEPSPTILIKAIPNWQPPEPQGKKTE